MLWLAVRHFIHLAFKIVIKEGKGDLAVEQCIKDLLFLELKKIGEY